MRDDSDANARVSETSTAADEAKSPADKPGSAATNGPAKPGDPVDSMADSSTGESKTDDAETFDTGDRDEDDAALPHDSLDAFFRSAVIYEVGLGFLALFLGLVLGPDARESLPNLMAGDFRQVAEGLGWGVLAAIPMGLVVFGVMQLPLESVRRLEALGEEPTFRELMRLSLPSLFVLSFCAGVGEELFFRGWMVPAMESMLGGSEAIATTSDRGAAADSWLAIFTRISRPTWGALILSSLIFGLFHFITRLYVVVATFIGLYLGLLLVFTDNLLIPIVAHTVYDAAQFWLAKRREA
ncbi:MAG: CPBP family intramembrane glutamic endopeptidase [Planctomycetota bacterium]